MKRRVSLLAVLLLSLTLVTNSISIFATSESDPVSPNPIENENGNSVDDETNNDNSDENNENPDNEESNEESNEETNGVVTPDDTSLLGNPPSTVSGNDDGSTFSLMSVSGGDLSTWAGYGFEDASNPPDDAMFFFKGTAIVQDSDLGQVGSVGTFYTDENDGYKFLGYDGSSLITISTNGFEKIASPNDKDLNSILADYHYYVESDGEVVIDANYTPSSCRVLAPYSDSCYILVFSKNATSIDDLLYKISFDDIINGKYSSNDTPVSYDNSVPVGDASISVNLVEKLSLDGKKITGGKYAISFSVPQVQLTDGSIIDDEAVLIKIPEYSDYDKVISGSSGSVEIEALTLSNQTYTVIIKTKAYQQYSASFTVDYVEVEDPSAPDDVNNKETPQITFSAFPDGEHFEGEFITMTMYTNNVKTIMSFNGDTLANEAYVNSAEFKISRNGVYLCTAVSAAGKVTEVELVVDFFKPVENKEVTDDITDKLVDQDEDKLSQTGFGYSTVLYIFAILLICTGAFLLLNKKYKFLNVEVIKNAFSKK